MNKKEITMGRAGSCLPIWIIQAIQVCERCQSSSSALTLTSNAVRPLGQSCRLHASQWSVLSVCLDLMMSQVLAFVCIQVSKFPH